MNNLSPGIKTVKGVDVGCHAGIGVSSIYTSVIGFELLFSSVRLPVVDQNTTGQLDWGRDHFFQSKMSYKLFTRFDIAEYYSIKPYISLNHFTNYEFSYKKRINKFEYGTSFLYARGRVWYEFQISSFPEFDHLAPYKDPDDIFRIESIHLPYIGLNVNILFDDIEALRELKEDRLELFLNKHRGLSFEVGLIQIANGIGIRYKFKQKDGKSKSDEIGFRGGLTLMPIDGGVLTSYLYYGMNYNWFKKAKLNYSLNYGFEFGGGILQLYQDELMPYPHLMAYLENEFNKFFFRTGFGTGFYATLGYKLF